MSVIIECEVNIFSQNQWHELHEDFFALAVVDDVLHGSVICCEVLLEHCSLVNTLHFGVFEVEKSEQD